MTISQTPVLSEVLDWSPIPEEKLVYFRVRLKQRLYSFLLTKFEELEKKRDFTKAQLARRIGRGPDQISRWFGNPGNLELNTVSDLLLGMQKELLFTDSNLDSGMVTLDRELWSALRDEFGIGKSKSESAFEETYDGTRVNVDVFAAQTLKNPYAQALGKGVAFDKKPETKAATSTMPNSNANTPIYRGVTIGQSQPDLMRNKKWFAPSSQIMEATV